MTAAYIVLQENRMSTVFWTPHANRGSVCNLGNFQWCGELYFADAAISKDGCPPQISSRRRQA